MNRDRLAVVLCLLCLVPLAGAGSAPAENAGAAFARFKSLTGNWEAKGPMGISRVHYEIVAGGSVVLERFTSDELPKGSDMITAYHLDGDRLVLTHYCMAGNQPRMRARDFDPATGIVQFDFAGAGNLASPAAGHMHSAKFHFVDADHFTTEWQFVENGKPKFTETAKYTRLH